MLIEIEKLLADPFVTDVLISPPTGVWVDDGRGLHAVAGLAVTEESVRALAQELISRGGRHIDQLGPMADVRLSGGIRVHAVLAPIAHAGTAISIRVPRTQGWTLEDLVSAGMVSGDQAATLRTAVAHRQNILISGSTGTGKTTLLAALLAGVSESERIITIEDVAELEVRHPCVVGLEARQPNGDGVGAIGLGELVRQALRMRPDRLVVGECRGPELLDFLTALNTGHSGGGITLHANSLAQVPARLVALAHAHQMSATALTSLAGSAIDLVVHLERPDGQRRVAGIGVLRQTPEGLCVESVPSGATEP
jgi:pilus assembly protein CpaF